MPLWALFEIILERISVAVEGKKKSNICSSKKKYIYIFKFKKISDNLSESKIISYNHNFHIFTLNPLENRFSPLAL